MQQRTISKAVVLLGAHLHCAQHNVSVLERAMQSPNGTNALEIVLYCIEAYNCLNLSKNINITTKLNKIGYRGKISNVRLL